MPNPAPTCPHCGKRASRSMTQYGWRNDCCGLWSWGRKPLADGATHAARVAAHAAFDRLWHSRWLDRGEAYQALQWAMNLPPGDCHMATMTKEQALAVPAAVGRIWDVLRQSQPA